MFTLQTCKRFNYWCLNGARYGMMKSIMFSITKKKKTKIFLRLEYLMLLLDIQNMKEN